MTVLLEVKDLVIKFKSQGNIVYAVNNLSFKVYEGEILGNRNVFKKEYAACNFP
jgi:ABC-type glutathione transport system ATPase component